ncbi:MAG: YIP1 family protein [candidate division Zixibacteria bacterium]|nr:YIP1 family protein [candidate division Zixibacteria bacterium]
MTRKTDPKPPHNPGPRSSAGTIVRVFYRPAALFEEFRQNPRILVPYVIYAALIFLGIWLVKDVMMDDVLSDPAAKARIEATGQPVTAEIRRMMGIVQSLQVFAGYLVMPLVAAVLAMFWGNVVMAGRAGFRQVLSVMLCGGLIYGLGKLLIAPLILARQSAYVSLSLGVLAPQKAMSDVLYVALSRIDLFIIWEIIVIGIGLSILHGFSRNKGYVLSVLSMGLLPVLNICLTAIRQLFL